MHTPGALELLLGASSNSGSFYYPKALDALAEFDDPKVLPTLSEALYMYDTADAIDTAVNRLVKVGGPEAVRILTEAEQHYWNDGNIELAVRAIRGLMRIPDASVTDVLAKWISDHPDDDLKLDVARNLVERGDFSVRETLTKLATNPAFRFRAEAALKLLDQKAGGAPAATPAQPAPEPPAR